MNLAVSFPEGPTERSDSFLAIYRNQFGVVCWAYRDAESLLPLPNAETEATFRDSETDVSGSGAGAWLDG